MKMQNENENGNVLFLILIAVALFAALSYVVTQSTRSGAGSTEREKGLLSSAQIAQYPTSLRTAITRMVLSDVPFESIRFDTPGSVGFNTTSSSLLVFHPQGGGATPQQASADVSVTGNSALPWSYTANYEIPGIGSDGVGGNDIIAFLPGISNTVCTLANERLGINPQAPTPVACGNAVPQQATGTASDINDMLDVTVVTFPDGSSSIRLEPTNCTDIFRHKASGCFFDVDGNRNVYYSVLYER